MVRKIDIIINGVEHQVEYHGDTEAEIAARIEADENALLAYMNTEDEQGTRAFCFSGLMVRKSSIETARFREPIF